MIAEWSFHTIEAVGLVLVAAGAIIVLLVWVTKPQRGLAEGLGLAFLAGGGGLAATRAALELGEQAYWLLILALDLVFVCLMLARILNRRRHRRDEIEAPPAEPEAERTTGDREQADEHPPNVPGGTQVVPDPPEAEAEEAPPAKRPLVEPSPPDLRVRRTVPETTSGLAGHRLPDRRFLLGGAALGVIAWILRRRR